MDTTSRLTFTHPGTTTSDLQLWDWAPSGVLGIHSKGKPSETKGGKHKKKPSAHEKPPCSHRGLGTVTSKAGDG